MFSEIVLSRRSLNPYSSGARAIVFRTLVMLGVLAISLPPMAVLASSSTQTITQPSADGLHGEFCPARVTHWAFHRDGILALELGANHARRVSGSLEMQTDAGWFTASLPPTEVQRRVDHYSGSGGDWTRSVARSSPLYLRLPATVHAINMVWASSVSSLDAMGDWSHLGLIACAPQMAEIRVPQISRTPADQSWRDVDVLKTLLGHVSNSAQVEQTAEITEPHFACSEPFTKPVLLNGDYVLHFPRSILDQIMGLVNVDQRVSINAAGKIVDSRMLRSSGEMLIDGWARRSIRRGEFRPATAFCRPIPGQCFFGEELRPQ